MTARILIVDDVAANTRLLEAKLAADRPPAVTGEAGLQVLAVVHAAMRSSELKRPVELSEILNA